MFHNFRIQFSHVNVPHALCQHDRTMPMTLCNRDRIAGYVYTYMIRMCIYKPCILCNVNYYNKQDGLAFAVPTVRASDELFIDESYWLFVDRDKYKETTRDKQLFGATISLFDATIIFRTKKRFLRAGETIYITTIILLYRYEATCIYCRSILLKPLGIRGP